MIQVTRSEVVPPNSATLASLRAQFARQHYVILPNFLESSLLDYATQRLETASFYTHIHGKEDHEVAREQSVSADEPMTGSFIFLLNRPRLFELVQQITDCPPIGRFTGRFYRIQPNSDYHMDWHTDIGLDYMVGLSINLTVAAYTGGVFQLRDRQTQQILDEVGQIEFGSAHLFRISKSLEHRVTPTIGDVPRVVYTGWFRSETQYSTYIRSLFQPKKPL